MPDLPCAYCGLPVPLEWNLCPHCARPSLYPNVRAAEQPTERAALAKRYQAAVEDAESRGCGEVVRSFEKASGVSQAVIARSLDEVKRLVGSPRQLYATYHQLLDAEVQLPHGDEWDPLRRLADEKLFPGQREKIRFAALSLDGAGVPGFGECSLVLREEMIAHRASVFEGNSALLLARWAYNLLAGFRATWSERALLCVAKLSGRLLPATAEAEFAEILLQPGATPDEEDFIEVQVWGSMSAGTFARVLYMRPAGTPRSRSKTIAKDLRARLAKVGLDLEER